MQLGISQHQSHNVQDQDQVRILLVWDRYCNTTNRLWCLRPHH